MEDNEYEEQISQQSDTPDGSSQHVQVPPSLLPTVLQRLGLTPEQAQPAPSLEDLRVQLKSDDWVMRISAVRAMGKLDAATSVELLLSALDDQDGSVRAAAVQVLGNMGKRVPLHRLVTALYDTDWHVRETAVLALARQGQRVPKEVVMIALHDADASVRQTARLALDRLATEEDASAQYGRLWERQTMQPHEYKSSPASSTGTPTPLEPMPGYSWNGTGKHTGQFHGVQEQMQEYAPGEDVPQEFTSYEYSDTLSSRGGKLVLHRHRAQKGWWVALAAVAVFFFLLGSGITTWLIPLGLWIMPFPKSEIVKIMPTMVPGKAALFENPVYTQIAQNDIATALRLLPQAITLQLKQGRSMTGIAAAQGVSSSQLHNIELKAMGNFLGTAVQNGDIDSQQAGQWMQQFQSNPQLLEKVVTAMFLVVPPGG